jgi:hypothetical protein
LTFGAAKAADVTAQLSSTAMNNGGGAMSDQAMQDALKKGLEDVMKQQ